MPKNIPSRSVRLLSPSEGPCEPLRLFVFPYAGAGTFVYRPWARLLPKNVELVGIQLPGREDRFRDPPIDDLATVLRELPAEIAATYDDGSDWAVFGHSLGAVLACEVARALSASHGLAPARHILVSGCRALHLVHRNRQPVDALSDHELIEHMRTLNGTPEEILAEPAVMRFLLRLVRADYALFDQYRYLAETRLTSPVTVFAGDADPSTSPDTVEPWEQLTDGPCEVHTLPGDHFFLNQSRGLLLKLVEQILGS